jgi:hypothetical protein
MRLNRTCGWALTVSLAAMLAPTSVLAGERTVVIEVTEPTGAPVPGARVWIAADEKDAVTTTDGRGRTTFETRSRRLGFRAQKEGLVATAASTADRVELVLRGAPLETRAVRGRRPEGPPRAVAGGLQYVWAGANDSPNMLIRAALEYPFPIGYGPEVPTGGTTTGSATALALNQVRVYRGRASGACSLVAQTNDGSDNVSIYSINLFGEATPVPGSPFAAAPGVQSLVWAPDGGALYVPLAVAGSSQVLTYRVACTVGGPITVTNAGPVSLAGFDLLRDADVIGTGVGSHLCVSGTNNNAVGCFPIDPVTRLPGTNPVNTIPVSNARGMRIASNGCGVAAVGNANVVSSFARNGGMLIPINTAAHPGTPRYGAVSLDGSLAAFGSFGDDVALYSIAPATCTITLIDSNSLGNPAALVEYVAFDGFNGLWVADGLVNQLRMFHATLGGLGSALSTTTTNHPNQRPPGGIDAALSSSVPVTLQTFEVH